MNGPTNETSTVPDTELTGLMRWLPAAVRPYAALARFDRPIGWWLLFWPCLYGLGLAGGLPHHWALGLWMLLGAIVMRGAGCVYNDIVDRDLDARVARTRNRPIASGAVSLRSAWLWLALLAGIGGPEFAVLCGAVIGASRRGGVVVLDGFATGVAALISAPQKA